MNATRTASLALGVAVLLALPWLANSYLLSVATSVLYLAYVGQAWNIMMGFTGLLSLGHALYVGLGAYTAAGLYAHYGLGPWLGLWVAIAVALAFGSFIGFLAFRFSVSGVYFALLTIAFAEFTRIGFDHLEWFGGPAGLFLKVSNRDRIDLLDFRGPPGLYYYAILALSVGALLLCSWLLRGRAGYYWQAIREDERAAQALGIHSFRWKMLATAVSAALTALAGVFLAFYNNSLFPEQVFSTGRSIEIMLAPIIGGMGTLIGPLVGALALTLLGEGSAAALTAFGVELPGLKQVIYGLLLFSSVWLLPHGIWPPLSRALGLQKRW
jgi:branched-chain amino acid transport system permease protein